MATLSDLIKDLIKIDDFDSNQFNATLAEIQDTLGQTDGGYASILWDTPTDVEWKKGKNEVRIEITCNYIKAEFEYLCQ